MPGETVPQHTAPAGGPSAVLGVPVDEVLTAARTVALGSCARRLGARLLLLPLLDEDGSDCAGLVRGALAARDRLAGPDADPATGSGPVVEVRPVGLRRGGSPARDRARAVRLAVARGATHVPRTPLDAVRAVGGPELVALPAVALDVRSGAWAPADEVPLQHRLGTPASVVEDLVLALVRDGRDVPSGLVDHGLLRELRRRVRPRRVPAAAVRS